MAQNLYFSGCEAIGEASLTTDKLTNLNWEGFIGLRTGVEGSSCS